MTIQKTTDCTTQNYRPYHTKLQTVLHKTTDHTIHKYTHRAKLNYRKLHAHALH